MAKFVKLTAGTPVMYKRYTFAGSSYWTESNLTSDIQVKVRPLKDGKLLFNLDSKQLKKVQYKVSAEYAQSVE